MRRSTPPRKSRGAGAHVPRVDTGTHTPRRRMGKVRGQPRRLPDQTQPNNCGRSGIGIRVTSGAPLAISSPQPRWTCRCNGGEYGFEYLRRTRRVGRRRRMRRSSPERHATNCSHQTERSEKRWSPPFATPRQMCAHGAAAARWVMHTHCIKVLVS